MQIELSQEEAQALVNLLDVAVKAAGLQAAPAALGIVVKLQAAATADEPAKEA